MMRQNSLLVQAAFCLKISDDGHALPKSVHTTSTSSISQDSAVLPKSVRAVPVVRALTLQPALGAPPQQSTATESEPRPATARVEFSSVATTLSSRAEPVDVCAKYGGHRHFMRGPLPTGVLLAHCYPRIARYPRGHYRHVWRAASKICECRGRLPNLVGSALLLRLATPNFSIAHSVVRKLQLTFSTPGCCSSRETISPSSPGSAVVPTVLRQAPPRLVLVR